DAPRRPAPRGLGHGDARSGAPRHADGRVLPRVAPDRGDGPDADARPVDQPAEPDARARSRPGAIPGGGDRRAPRSRGVEASREPRGARRAARRVQGAPGSARRARRWRPRRAPRARRGRGGAVSALSRVAGPLAPPIAPTLVRALGTTLRLRVAGTEDVGRHWAAGQPVIYAVWHGQILMVPWLNERLRASHGARPATALVSRSGDGEIVARYLTRFGLDSVRGSTSRGAGEAGRAVPGRLRPAARRGAGRRPRTRDEGRRAKPRRGDGRGRDAGGAVMYMLYTAAMLVALVLFYAPAAVAKRLRRGVPLDARARL